MKDKIGVIFDFNGTCLFNGKLHDEAWKMYIEELTMVSIGEDELNREIKGKNPKDILEHFIGYEISDNMLFQFSGEKERIYRSLLKKSGLTLAPGLEDFLNYLTLCGIKKTIASITSPENMSYYFELFGLEKWFKWENVIIAAGNIPVKPAPDVYLAAMNKLGITAENAVAFEDSNQGVTSAFNAGIRHIIGVTGDSNNHGLVNKPGVYAVIRDFTELSAENFRLLC